MLSKGMGERFLLSEDEPLTPNIDGVMALWIFRRRAQNTKIGRKSAKIGPLDPSFYFFRPRPLVRSCSDFFREGIGSERTPWKNLDVLGPSEALEINSPNLVQAVFPYELTFLHFAWRVCTHFFVLEGQSSIERHTERLILWRWLHFRSFWGGYML